MQFIKPNVTYHSQYREMLDEWLADGSRIAPWTLHLPYASAEDFAALVARCEEVERGENIGDFAPNSTWWLYDEAICAIGSTTRTDSFGDTSATASAPRSAEKATLPLLCRPCCRRPKPAA